ncbi:helix-turn-helix domain-containing protein [Hazenella coriacea]|uniref:Cytoskeletal protein RodZ n=1 Tax=Hazenella coriacea TaxID=1179467 RepID=A0A4R3L190_9BACL|nr:helix-turn-helix domain-containing protein [Hazenella coriacea]TCS92583.1 cytoskeletal protein RodZ [Hazenella coriacea]
MSVEIGSFLRQARESIGLSLDQLQEKTRIQKSFLVAIENGEFNKLPSPFYVRTYLRSYANCVKVEPHHILRQYRKEEQRERGLTGVHKVVTEDMLNNSFTSQQTLQLPHLTGQTMSMPTIGSQFQSGANHAKHRTSAHTALTIAKNQELTRKSSDSARRDLGYQRTSGGTRSTPGLPIAESESVPSQSRAVVSKSTNPIKRYADESTVNRTRSADTTPLSGTRNLKDSNPSMRTTDPSMGRVWDKNQTGTQRSQKSAIPADEIPTRSSRSSRSKKELTQSSMPPVASGSIQEIEDQPESQVALRFDQLSRSAVKNNRKSKKATQDFPVKMVSSIAAGILVCGGLVWGATQFFGDDQTDTSSANDKKVTSNNKNQVPSEVMDQTTIATVSESAEQNTYQLSGVKGKVKLTFVGSGGESRVAIANTGIQIESNLMEDKTVTRGFVWDYEYDFDQNKDLWIKIGEPKNISIKVNGREIGSSKLVNVQYTK